MQKEEKAFITFDKFLLDIGIQRGGRMPSRYLYLNRALDVLFENPKEIIEKIYLIIADEQNTSKENVEEEMLLAIKEIFSRKEQKETFIKIFGNETKHDSQVFLKKIIKAYKELISEE